MVYLFNVCLLLLILFKVYNNFFIMLEYLLLFYKKENEFEGFNVVCLFVIEVVF